MLQIIKGKVRVEHHLDGPSRQSLPLRRLRISLMSSEQSRRAISSGVEIVDFVLCSYEQGQKSAIRWVKQLSDPLNRASIQTVIDLEIPSRSQFKGEIPMRRACRVLLQHKTLVEGNSRQAAFVCKLRADEFDAKFVQAE